MVIEEKLKELGIPFNLEYYTQNHHIVYFQYGSVLFSYGKLVAFSVSGQDYIVNKYLHYSKTTSKHINKYFDVNPKLLQKLLNENEIKLI